MNANEYISEIEEKQAELLHKKKRMESLKNRLHDHEIDLSDQMREMKKEEKDVFDLENNSIKNLFNRLSGKMDDVARKEQGEFFDAKVKYEQLQNAVLKSKEDVSKTKEEVDTLETEVKTLIETARQDFPEIEEHYTKMEARLAKLKSQAKELREAMDSGKRVISSINMAIDKLETARGWATYDMFSKNGIFSHMAKYGNTDEAQEIMYNLSYLMDNFKAELRDVNMFLHDQIENYSTSTRFFDYFFDNIFTDMAVRNKIDDDIDKLASIGNKVGMIIEKLQREMENAATGIRELEEQI